MRSDAPTGDERAVERAARFAALGHAPPLSAAQTSDVETAVAGDPDARVRAAALAAIVRAGAPDAALACWRGAVADDAPQVRRRAADLAPALAAAAGASAVPEHVVVLLDDPDVTVVVAAAWALGELGPAAAPATAVARLSAIAVEHRDALAREGAVAALGALGDRGGLPAILAACGDKPAVRRRAVLALAPFDGDDVDAALRRALEDRDWQVRQAAEDLRG